MPKPDYAPREVTTYANHHSGNVTKDISLERHGDEHNRYQSNCNPSKRGLIGLVTIPGPSVDLLSLWEAKERSNLQLTSFT